MPVTVSMSTDFIRPVQPGPVRGEGHVTSMGSSLAFLEAKLADPAGRVLTRATGAYRLLPFRDAVPEPPGEPERPG